MVAGENHQGLVGRAALLQRLQNPAQLPVDALRQAGVGMAVQTPAFLVIAFARQALEGAAGLHPRDGLGLLRRNVKIVRQRRAMPGEKLVARHTGRDGQGRVQLAQFVAVVSLKLPAPLLVGKVADGHVADVVRIDEAGHQAEGALMRAAQDLRAGPGQFIAIVPATGLETQVLRRPARWQMLLAAPERTVAGAAQLPAQGRLPDLIRNFSIRSVVVVQDAELAAHAPRHQAETRGQTHGVAAPGLGETQALPGDAVHGRRAHMAGTGATHHGSALLIAHNQQDVGPLSCHAAGHHPVTSAKSFICGEWSGL